MDIEIMIERLHGKDTKDAYANLLELEQISETNNTLYDYFDDFLKMIDSEKYVIRLRGYRLLCKQAKWDKDNKLDKNIDKILTEIDDDKQTAIRQKIKAVEDIVKNKPGLAEKIKEKIIRIDCSKYRESMAGLIEKDIEKVLALISDI